MCVHCMQTIVGDNIYMPLDSRLSNTADVVCFKAVNFGVSAFVALRNVLYYLFFLRIPNQGYLHLQVVQEEVRGIQKSVSRKFIEF